MTASTLFDETDGGPRARAVPDRMESFAPEKPPAFQRSGHFARADYGAKCPSGSGRDGARSDPIPAELSGHIRLLAKPGYGQLLAREPLLRKAIPLLTVIFVLVIAAYRIAITVDDRARVEENARATLPLIASSLASEVGRRAAQNDGLPLAALLAEALPDAASKDGRLVALMEGGAVTVTAPFSDEFVGAPVATMLGDNQPLTTFGARAGVMTVVLDNADYIATVHHIPGIEASVAVLQPINTMLGGWRDKLATTAVLFMCTAGVIIVLVYAFYAQSARARSADQIYSATRARIDTALTRGRCGLFDWDLAHGRMFWTKSMFEVLGMPPREELMGFGEVAELVHPDDGNLYDIAERHLASGEIVLDRSLRMRHADGHWIWMRIRAELVQNIDGEARHPHLIGVALDVTEQKKLAERSAAADARLRDAIETVSEAFVLWDHRNELLMCNTKYQEMHGLPDAAVQVGTPYKHVIGLARQPVVSMKETPGTGSTDDRSYEAELAGGRWLKINERRTKDGGFVSVGTDITTLKQQAAELSDKEKKTRALAMEAKRQEREALRQQKSATNLANERADLAAKLAEEKDRAEEANRAKSEFLANVSHELRTPLNAIIGFSEMMKGHMFGPLGAPKYEEYCADIHDSSSHLLGVINDILDMSRIEAGQVDLSVETVDLAELFSEATRIMTPTSAEKNITLASAIAEGMRIQVDRRAMKQILLNLMSNAVKFTAPDGRVTVRARLERESVVVAVEDNGIGIPAREVERLGQPFVQVENQFTKTHQGSGLGLAIARSLTELHHGKMDISSEVGQGTTVTVRLPRDASKVDPKLRQRADKEIA